MPSFMKHVDMSNEETKKYLMDWVMKYDMTKPFTGDVFGGWDERAVAETKGKGAKFEFRKSLAGFIKHDLGRWEGPPVIISSKRYVQEGKIIDLINAY